MKTLAQIFLACLLTTVLHAQNPVLFGLQKITTRDPDTLNNGIVINGTDTLGTWNPNLNDNPYSFVKVDPLSGHLLSQLSMDSAKGVLVNSATYDPWNKEYVFFSENLYPAAGQQYYDPNVPTTYHLHRASVQSSASTRNNLSQADSHFEPQYDAQKQKIFCITQAFTPGNAYTFAEVDPQTGGMNPLFDLPELNGPSRGTSCYDSNHGIYYLIGLDTLPALQFFAIHVDSQRVDRVSISPAEIWLDLEYDLNTDNLYGIQGTQIQDSMTLWSIDPVNGNTSAIRRIPPYQTLGTATYEFASGQYIFTSGANWEGDSPRLLSVNMATGQIVADTVLQDWVYELQCDNSEFIQTRYGNLTAVISPEVASLKLYPQPAGDWLRVQTDFSGSGTYEIWGLHGNLVKKGTFSGESFELSLGSLGPGYYHFILRQGTRQVSKALVRGR